MEPTTTIEETTEAITEAVTELTQNIDLQPVITELQQLNQLAVYIMVFLLIIIAYGIGKFAYKWLSQFFVSF
jgi:hypothetical protein